VKHVKYITVIALTIVGNQRKFIASVICNENNLTNILSGPTECCSYSEKQPRLPKRRQIRKSKL